MALAFILPAPLHAHLTKKHIVHSPRSGLVYSGIIARGDTCTQHRFQTRVQPIDQTVPLRAHPSRLPVPA